MLGVHPLAELAPRDVVSREIERVMQRCGRNNVWLDARHLGEEYLRARFPTIWEACAEAGYDLSRDLVPVAPAAHYIVGGVRVDIDGRTSVPGPLRLRRGDRERAARRQPARLELAARGARVLSADRARARCRQRRRCAARSHREPDGASVTERHCRGAAAARSEGRHAAVRRDEPHRRGPRRGRASCSHGYASVRRAPRRRHQADLELANLVTVGTLITHAAWLRTESRGCHSRLDFPERDDEHWRVSHRVPARIRPAPQAHHAA